MSVGSMKDNFTQNKLATKDNLVRRGVTQLDSLVCSGGCGFNETSNHLFFECDFFCNLWRDVVKLLKIDTTFSIDICFHALQFDSGFICLKRRHTSV
jgi:hypothetical protein